MRTSNVSLTTVAILVGAAIASVVPAAAQSGDPSAARDHTGSPVDSAHHDQVVLRRDGESAVPFDPVIGAGNEPVLRRDGSTAVPFAAEAGPQAASADEGFDWGDAIIGAGSAYALILLASGALVLVRRRRPRVQPSIRHGDPPTQVAA